MDVDLRFTDKQITARGGMATMKRMLDHLGFDAALTAAKLPLPSNGLNRFTYQANAWPKKSFGIPAKFTPVFSPWFPG